MKTTPSYQVKKGSISLDGKKVGAVDAKGDFRITGPDGKTQSGNVAALIRADFERRAGPSGKMRVATHLIDVTRGVASCNGTDVGTVNAEGDFTVTLDGTTHVGNTGSTVNAVWLYKEKKTHPSGQLQLGKLKFTAVNGVVFEGREPIGWWLADGRFRFVNLEGLGFAGMMMPRKQQLAIPRTYT